MFTFPLEPAELFEERAPQMVGWGIPKSVVADVRSQVRDMWSEEPGGWVPAWAGHAERAEREGEWLLAARCWGAARFPCLATPSRKAAYERQLAAYERARPGFPTRFERLELDVPFEGNDTPVPVHLFRRRRRAGRSLVVLSGGVDTWKIELHRLATGIARATGLIVAAVDMPGTGESQVPLTPTGDRILAGVVEQVADRVGAERTSFFGISFGGHWAAKLALTGEVAAAIDLGGPVGAGETTINVANLPNGMTGIVAHALGLDRIPTEEETEDLVDSFSLRRQGLLDAPTRAHLLAVNGENDLYIPLADTTVFASHPRATVWVVKDAGHCAAERVQRVTPAAVGWLTARLNPDSGVYRAVQRALRLALRPHLAALPSRASAGPTALERRTV
jgi:esterase FrsA